MRKCNRTYLRDIPVVRRAGLTTGIVGDAVDYVYQVLDSIDEKLVEGGSDPFATFVELATLSAIVGNLFRRGVERASGGRFVSNLPHTYPDLLGIGKGCADIEIKVALETNKPKGHLVKAGSYLTVRYVLGAQSGAYSRGKQNRGAVVWIWEVRLGSLDRSHFNFSNTEGDSGKTAVINARGMSVLGIVYCDLDRTPLSPEGRLYAELASLYE